MNELHQTLLFFLRLFDKEGFALLLSLPRLYAFLVTSQLLAPTSVPRLARNVVILSIAVIAVPINLPHVDQFDRSATSFAFVFAKEYAIGFVLGYLVGWVFWAVQSAGALIDNQRGAAIASSIDPLQGHEASPLGILFSQAFLTYVFAAGAVLPIFGVLYQSFVLWPVTNAVPVISDQFPAMALALADHALRFVVILAGPIVAIMFLAEFALAMISRFAPQIQVFILAMPIKSALAIFILIFYFSLLLPYATRQLSSFPNYAMMLYAAFNAGSANPPPAVPPAAPPQGAPQ
jgi:type III secretion protein T